MITKDKTIKARVSEELRARLQQYADKTDKTISEIIREAINEYLNNKEKQ